MPHPSSSSSSGTTWHQRFNQLHPQCYVKLKKEASVRDKVVREMGGNEVLVFRDNADPRLIRWVETQRKRHKKPNKDAGDQVKINMLNDMHFIWEVDEFIWNVRLNEFNEFRRKHGHCIVPRSCKHFPRLGKWVDNLRGRKKRGSLTEKKIEELDDLNFAWEPNKDQWSQKFEELKEFCNKNGHANVTPSNADESLARWAQNQRQVCKIEERRKMLDSIEFIWSFSEARDEQWLDHFNQLNDCS